MCYFLIFDLKIRLFQMREHSLGNQFSRHCHGVALAFVERKKHRIIYLQMKSTHRENSVTIKIII